MPTASVSGTEIYYEVHGAGEPLLLIAGFACDHTVWSLAISALASHYRVVAFDNRGLGQSPGPDVRASICLMADDATRLIDVLGIGPVHVAGHSMGRDDCPGTHWISCIALVDAIARKTCLTVASAGI